MPSFSQIQHFFRENLVCEKEGMQILVFYFSLYYNVNGVSMARRHWKIPSSSLGEKKFEFPTRGFAARGKFFFFLPRDLEGIFQYLLAIFKPLHQYLI